MSNNKLNCKKCKKELEPNSIEKCKFSLIGKISDKSGSPTVLGYLLHALVFTLLVRYSMEMNI